MPPPACRNGSCAWCSPWCLSRGRPRCRSTFWPPPRLWRSPQSTPVEAGRSPCRSNEIVREIGQPIAVQIAAMHVEPDLGALVVAAQPAHDAPEARRMIHLDKMRHLVCGEVIEHEVRRHDET